ncbi:MAG: EAL domain-containing protein [Planctomycetes bacterium]|nr:EAL domain-containing protein [Planctomycetota bacterium]
MSQDSPIPPPRILVASEDPELRQQLLSLLESKGYPTTIAAQPLVVRAALERTGAEAVLSAVGSGSASSQVSSSPLARAEQEERAWILAELPRAIEREEIDVYYQRRVRLFDLQVVGVEALARWHHRERGFVEPSRFIPIAEEAGLIQHIGAYVLRRACMQASQWRRDGLALLRVSVNVSPAQFRDAALAGKVVSALTESELPPSMLELEITESMVMSDPQRAIETLWRLRHAGVAISIDDFGTGYSSLSYLQRMPVSALKIDQSFIRQVPAKAESAAVTTAVVLLGQSLKLHVVAEGVETQTQLSFLQAVGCDEVQGYLFGRPLPAGEFARSLRAGAPEPAAR